MTDDRYGKIHTDGSRSGGQPSDDSIEPKEVFRNKAIALINEYRQQRGLMPIQFLEIITPEISAFIRSIQLHEKTKQELADFKQKVSDAVEKVNTPTEILCLCGRKNAVAFIRLDQFIIPKPDPLVEVIKAMQAEPTTYVTSEVYANRINAALDALGFEIREKGQ
jgi:hypothetical protein